MSGQAWLLLLGLATAIDGLLAGASLDQSIKLLPARHRIGMRAFSAYSAIVQFEWSDDGGKRVAPRLHRGGREFDSLTAHQRKGVTTGGAQPMARFLVRELGRETWRDFVRIMEKHDGVWGGCWCVTFHLKPGGSNQTPTPRRAYKETLVRENRSQAALVYDGADVVGWCQYGPPDELPGRMRGFAKLGVALPDWRITCFFVDRNRRREGIAEAALAGALRIIAAKGGGTVDGYPVATRGKPYSSSFLWGGTESMFAEVGFRPVGSLGTSKMVMRRVVRNDSDS